jgi:hypothetical protein
LYQKIKGGKKKETPSCPWWTGPYRRHQSIHVVYERGAQQDDKTTRGRHDEDDQTKKGRHIEKQHNNQPARQEDKRVAQQEDEES